MLWVYRLNFFGYTLFVKLSSPIRFNDIIKNDRKNIVIIINKEVFTSIVIDPVSNLITYPNDKIIISSKTYWTGYKYESRLYSNSFFQNSNIDFEDSKTRLDIELNDLDMCQKYGYAVGEMGNYLISTNYGLDWTQKNIANYSEVSITNVKFYNDSTGIVTTMNGDFLKTNDYGITWEKILSLNENEITDFEIKNSSIYIIGKNGFTTEIDLDI